jgi:branched-chain amino acid transport system substrate-binding protein
MRILSVISALSCALVLSVLPVQAADIKIGFPGPITGNLGFLGEHMKWGAQLAADEINASGGVLGGKKIKIIMGDSKCAPADSVSVVERLISQEKVDVLLGDICSGATLADMPIAKREGRPMLVTISSHPAISQKSGVGGNPWVFRTSPTDAIIGQIGGKGILDQGFKSIAFIAEDTDYGRAGVESVKQVLGDKVAITSTDFTAAAQTDFLSVLTRLRSQKPDAIAIYLLDRQLFNFMKQYQQFKLKIPLVGRPPLGSGLVADLVKSGDFNGSWTVFQYLDSYDSKENIAFVTNYKKVYGQRPHFAGFAMYEGINIIAEAIRSAGSADPEKIRDALKKTNYNSILGKIRFDDHHQAHNSILQMTIIDGTLKITGVVGQ